MPALDSSHLGAPLAQAGDGSDQTLVICLCADWCVACRAWRPVFDELAGRHPEQRWVWLDTEDDEALLGDLDIENFPTIVVRRAGQELFAGTIEPRGPVLERLVESLAGR